MKTQFHNKLRICKLQGDSVAFRECLYTSRRKIRVTARMSIEHGTHCVFLDDYWETRARDQTNFFSVIADIYEAVVCVYLPTAHNFFSSCMGKKHSNYIIGHFNQMKNSFFFSSIWRINVCTATKMPPNIIEIDLKMSINFTHTCFVCFVHMLRSFVWAVRGVECVAHMILRSLIRLAMRNGILFDLMEWLTYLF